MFRGSIELKKAVISPSEEDSTTFTIHSFDNELFKLRASDAKERQHWVNVLRFVVHSNSNETDMLMPILSNRSNSSSSSSCNNNVNINENNDSNVLNNSHSTFNDPKNSFKVITSEK